MKGYVFIVIMAMVVFVLIRIHILFMKSNFYATNIKARSYSYELRFYVFVIFPIILFSILGSGIVLSKLFYE